MRSLTLVLATARLTSLIAEDELTEPLRARVRDWAEGAPDGSLRERVQYLSSCSRCVSVWAGALILAAWLLPPGRPVVKALALSQAALGTLTAIDTLERRG